MSNSTPSSDEPALTLDAPGSIAVIGAGVLGIEAALYGRFLGYEVTLFEATSVGGSLIAHRDQPLPLLPNRCLSPLALSALAAQQGETVPPVLPTTIAGWIDEALVPLTESDLLVGRVRMPARVTQIDLVAVQADQEEDGDEESTDEIPPDFRITSEVGDDPDPSSSAASIQTLDVEAVIVATGPDCQIKLGFSDSAPYFFRIGSRSSGNAESDLAAGLQEIVAIFAGLGGRADLDLYRPRRG